MAEEISAVAMVAYFGGCVAQLRGRAVYVQFSNHKELKTDQTHSNAVRYININKLYHSCILLNLLAYKSVPSELSLNKLLMFSYASNEM